MNKALHELLKNRELKAFLDKVMMYRTPNRKYYNKLLTDVLDNIDTDIDEFLNFIEFINKIKTEGERPTEELLNDDMMLDRLKTGVMSISESSKKDEEDVLGLNKKYQYDALINLQLIDGIVNDENIDDVKCPYKNQMLNTIYNDLKYAEQKNPVLFYTEEKPFEMGKTQKGGRKYNKTQKKRCGGFIGRTIKSINSIASSLKKKRRKPKSNKNKINYTSPYKTI